jgi:hypothetical protein
MPIKFIEETSSGMLEYSDTSRVEVVVVEGATITEIISAFKKFLIATGYTPSTVEDNLPDVE